MVRLFSVCGLMGLLLLTACASSKHKARQEQREKMVSSSGLYCEWISGDKHADLDVELNLQMAKRCDSAKPFSLTPYKNSADQNGILYCCGTQPAPRKGNAPAVSKATTSPAAPSSSESAAPASAKPATGSSSDELTEDK